MVPTENIAEALEAAPDGLQIVPVDTIDDALAFLEMAAA
jgi:hypothetical protein